MARLDSRFAYSRLYLFASDPIFGSHLDEGWHLHQPAILRQGGLHECGMWSL